MQVWKLMYSNDETLDKEATSYNGIFDALRLTLKYYHFEEKSKWIHIPVVSLSFHGRGSVTTTILIIKIYWNCHIAVNRAGN